MSILREMGLIFVGESRSMTAGIWYCRELMKVGYSVNTFQRLPMNLGRPVGGRYKDSEY